MVPLYAGLTFADFEPKLFSFTPPAGCSAPWRQFDRTGSIWIGGANVYLGTTSEPSATVARSWHIESDLTDYSALFFRATRTRGAVVVNTLTAPTRR